MTLFNIPEPPAVNPNPPDDDTVKVILVGDLDAAAVAELVGEHAIVIVGTRAAVATVAHFGVLYQRVDTARLGAVLKGVDRG